MDTVVKAENLSQLCISETVNGETVCGKAARTGLWGSGKVTNRSTHKITLRDSTVRQLTKTS